MFNFFETITSWFNPKPKKPEIDIKGLEKKTKAELEKLGRKVGIELDKRLTKAKLISQIKKHCK